MESIQEDLLVEEAFLAQASQGKRLANYIIDVLLFYILIFCVSFVIGMFNPAFFDSMDDSAGAKLLDRLLSLILYGIYMGVMEGIFKGRTLGKVITGTRVVNEDGSAITFSTAFKRGLCRMVPFNPFSALSKPCYPWHDQWTNTYVIDIKQSILPTVH